MAMTLLAFLLVSCARGEIPGSKWRGMTRNEKLLVVDSLRGHEAALAAKGGLPSSYAGTNDEYVTRIDAAYAGGDGRTVTAIWKGFARQRAGG
ncbi:MAG: hypothetical protein ABI718_05625 [Acidobacteriota bacterium]